MPLKENMLEKLIQYCINFVKVVHKDHHMPNFNSVTLSLPILFDDNFYSMNHLGYEEFEKLTMMTYVIG